MFPKLAVCLDCGFTEFTVPESELRVLVKGIPAQGSTVLVERFDRASKKGPEPDFLPRE
jgi:hypothetical protein